MDSCQWRSQAKNLGGAKIFDFRRITLVCLEKRLSKHKMTICSKMFWGHGPFAPPVATPMIPAYGDGFESFLEVIVLPFHRRTVLRRRRTRLSLTHCRSTTTKSWAAETSPRCIDGGRMVNTKPPFLARSATYSAPLSNRRRKRPRPW